MSNKIYPIGIQNFEKIRKGGYCYIDKTAWIYQMVKTGFTGVGSSLWCTGL